MTVASPPRSLYLPLGPALPTVLAVAPANHLLVYHLRRMQWIPETRNPPTPASKGRSTGVERKFVRRSADSGIHRAWRARHPIYGGTRGITHVCIKRRQKAKTTNTF